VKRSAGILLWRGSGTAREVLLVHPGGPFWARKDLGAWSIPKGEFEEDEEPLACARREFAEELGSEPPPGLVAIGSVRQKNKKEVLAWAGEGDLDVTAVRSNTFTIEWPPRSGRQAEFPEIDRAEWFPLDVARAKLNPAQAEFLDRPPVSQG
jgi:predicted NUDIX family NTP pyrophosphohydrolase